MYNRIKYLVVLCAVAWLMSAVGSPAWARAHDRACPEVDSSLRAWQRAYAKNAAAPSAETMSALIPIAMREATQYTACASRYTGRGASHEGYAYLEAGDALFTVAILKSTLHQDASDQLSVAWSDTHRALMVSPAGVLRDRPRRPLAQIEWLRQAAEPLPKSRVRGGRR